MQASVPLYRRTIDDIRNELYQKSAPALGRAPTPVAPFNLPNNLYSIANSESAVIVPISHGSQCIHVGIGVVPVAQPSQPISIRATILNEQRDQESSLEIAPNLSGPPASILAASALPGLFPSGGDDPRPKVTSLVASNLSLIHAMDQVVLLGFLGGQLEVDGGQMRDSMRVVVDSPPPESERAQGPSSADADSPPPESERAQGPSSADADSPPPESERAQGPSSDQSYNQKYLSSTLFTFEHRVFAVVMPVSSLFVEHPREDLRQQTQYVKDKDGPPTLPSRRKRPGSPRRSASPSGTVAMGTSSSESPWRSLVPSGEPPRRGMPVRIYPSHAPQPRKDHGVFPVGCGVLVHGGVVFEKAPTEKEDEGPRGSYLLRNSRYLDLSNAAPGGWTVPFGEGPALANYAVAVPGRDGDVEKNICSYVFGGRGLEDDGSASPLAEPRRCDLDRASGPSGAGLSAATNSIALKAKVYKVTSRGWEGVNTTGDVPCGRESASAAIIPLQHGLGLAIVGGLVYPQKRVVGRGGENEPMNESLQFASRSTVFVLSLQSRVWRRVPLESSIPKVPVGTFNGAIVLREEQEDGHRDGVDEKLPKKKVRSSFDELLQMSSSTNLQNYVLCFLAAKICVNVEDVCAHLPARTAMTDLESTPLKSKSLTKEQRAKVVERLTPKPLKPHDPAAQAYFKSNPTIPKEQYDHMMERLYNPERWENRRKLLEKKYLQPIALVGSGTNVDVAAMAERLSVESVRLAETKLANLKAKHTKPTECIAPAPIPLEQYVEKHYTQPLERREKSRVALMRKAEADEAPKNPTRPLSPHAVARMASRLATEDMYRRAQSANVLLQKYAPYYSGRAVEHAAPEEIPKPHVAGGNLSWKKPPKKKNTVQQSQVEEDASPSSVLSSSGHYANITEMADIEPVPVEPKEEEGYARAVHVATNLHADTAEPASEPVAEPVAQPASAPAAEPVDQPVDQPAPEPAEPVTEPAPEPVDQPVDQPATEPVDQPASAPAAEPVDQPVDQPAPEPAEPVTEPAPEPVDQPVDQPATEPAEPASEPVAEFTAVAGWGMHASASDMKVRLSMSSVERSVSAPAG